MLPAKVRVATAFFPLHLIKNNPGTLEQYNRDQRVGINAMLRSIRSFASPGNLDRLSITSKAPPPDVKACSNAPFRRSRPSSTPTRPRK